MFLLIIYLKKFIFKSCTFDKPESFYGNLHVVKEIVIGLSNKLFLRLCDYDSQELAFLFQIVLS